MKSILAILVLCCALLPARAQVAIVEQRFNYLDFSFDITLVNTGPREVLLTGIGADYDVYIYLIWMGIIPAPTLKPAAAYKLPVYFTRGGGPHVYARREMEGRNEGFWQCRARLPAEPILTLAPNTHTRLRVQIQPQGFKPYYEMDVDIHLVFTLADSSAVRTKRIKIVTEDVLGVLWADTILKKTNVLRTLGAIQPRLGTQTLRLNAGSKAISGAPQPSRHDGKEGYDYGREDAVLHLDKFDLPADTVAYWLARMLRDDDERVRANACKMIRKNHLIALTDAVRGAWNDMVASENPDYLMCDEIVYTLAVLGRTDYIDSTLRVFLRSNISDFAFGHLIRTEHPAFFEKLQRYLSDARDSLLQPGNSDEMKVENLFSTWAGAYRPESQTLLIDYLQNARNPAVLTGILSGLSALRAEQRPLLRPLKTALAGCTARVPVGRRPELVTLLAYAESAPAASARILLDALADPQLGSDNWMWGKAEQVQRDLSFYPKHDRHWLWQFFSRLPPVHVDAAAEVDSLSVNRLLALLDSLTRPAGLATLSPRELRFRYHLLSGSGFVGRLDSDRSAASLSDPLRWYAATIEVAEALHRATADTALFNRLPEHYTTYARRLRLAARPGEATRVCLQGLKRHDKPELYRELAPAYLLDGETQKARAIYEHWKNKPFDEGRTFGSVMLNDLESLEYFNRIPENRRAEVEAIRLLLKN